MCPGARVRGLGASRTARRHVVHVTGVGTLTTISPAATMARAWWRKARAVAHVCAAGWYTAACDLECADSAPDTFDSSWPSECNSVCCDESGLGSEGCPPANATEILQSEGFTNGYKDLCLATCSVCTPASVKDVAALAKKTRGRSIVALPTSREDQDSTENDVVIYYYNPADTTRPPTSGWLKDATSPQTLVTYVV